MGPKALWSNEQSVITASSMPGPSYSPSLSQMSPRSNNHNPGGNRLKTECGPKHSLFIVCSRKGQSSETASALQPEEAGQARGVDTEHLGRG